MRVNIAFAIQKPVAYFAYRVEIHISYWLPMPTKHFIDWSQASAPLAVGRPLKSALSLALCGAAEQVKKSTIGVAWCCALFPVYASAQAVDSSQAYLRECTERYLAAQAAAEKKMKEISATEGQDSPKVVKFQNALAGYAERRAKKCEEGAQLEAKGAQLEAKGAQIRQETAQLEAKVAQLEAKGAQIRQETAQIAYIKNRFDKMGEDQPKIDNLLKGLISQRWSAIKQKEAVAQIDAFVSETKETVRLTRADPNFQTPEYHGLLASIEQNIQTIHQTLHGK